jgi:hypothetical protein
MVVGIDQMKFDVTLHHFRHEAVESASAGREGMHDDGAIEFFFERTFGRIELAADAADAIDEFFLVPDGMGH